VFDNPARLTAMRRIAMKKVFGWDEPAAAYQKLFEDITGIAPVQKPQAAPSAPSARKVIVAPMREERVSAA
jgi:hypothetical protein